MGNSPGMRHFTKKQINLRTLCGKPPLQGHITLLLDSCIHGHVPQFSRHLSQKQHLGQARVCKLCITNGLLTVVFMRHAVVNSSD